MPQKTLYRLANVGRARLAMAGVFVLVIVLGISWLAVDLARQVEERSESRSDNAQWLLSQFELELLYLVSVADAVGHGTAELDDVRLRYDIFYGRLKMLQEGRVSILLKQDPEFEAGFARLDEFVQTYLPLIDGPDDVLRDCLPKLALDGLSLTKISRQLALAGVRISASQSDMKRAEVALTLSITGALTSALVVFLLALLVALLRLYRFNRSRSAENIATLSRLDAVVTTTMEALITVDDQGRVVDVNDAARNVFGLGEEGAKGLDMAGLFVGTGGRAEPFRPGQSPDVTSQGRYRLTVRRPDGGLVPVEISISRVTGMEPPLFVVFLRDLSAQLQAEQALVSARDKALAGEKAKADLLVVMSHEIRTPLNGVIGTVELLDATPMNSQQREYLRILQASGRLLLHHVNDVLNISRLDSGVSMPAVEPVDLVEVMREVIANQQPASQLNGNAMVMEAPKGEGFVVLSDGAQLRQVLLNLVGNAVKFTRNGQISLVLSEDEEKGEVLIQVRDSGIGIAKADLERIFDDFVTLDASYARSASGTGLGLGIVRRIIRQMGGRLSVESCVGEGSTFSLHLPLRRPHQDAAVAAKVPLAEGPAARHAGLRVLVVEDNEFNRLITLEFLRLDGHVAAEVKDGEAGVALARDQEFDVILMDISMPGLDGVQATQLIRASDGPNRNTPIIAMTAHALGEDRERFAKGGLGWVLVKPITREALRAALQRAVPTGRQAMQPNQILDHRILSALAQDLGAERAASLIGRFREEVRSVGSRIVAALNEASGASPDPEVARLAHKLTGSAVMFGAVALSKSLAEIDLAAKEGQAADLSTLAPGLLAVLRATEAALQDDALAQASSLR